MKNKSKKGNLSKNKVKKRNNKTLKNNTSLLLNKTLDIIIKETASTKINNYNKNTLVHYLKTPFKKEIVDLPKNDYYNYINDKWLKDLIVDKQLKYLTKIDDFRLVQYKVYNELIIIIEDYIKKNINTKLGTELKNFYASATNLNSIINSKNYLKESIKYIDELRKDKNNLWKMLAYINKNEITNKYGPFGWDFSPDKKNSKEYCNYINPHTFAIFDLNIYYDTTYDNKQIYEYKKRYRKFFISYLKKLFKVVVNDDSLKPIDTFNVAQKLFNAMGCSTEKESPDFYNKVTAKESLEKYNFNWDEYSKELGFKITPPYFVTTSLNYLKCCSELLMNEWNSEEWRGYWIWVIARYVGRITNNWRKIFYEFYGKKTKGMEEIYPENLSAITFTMLAFNNLLNNEYIDKFYVERDVEYTKNMANDIRNVFKNIISRNTWLSPKTKSYALFKLNKLTMNIGSNKFNLDDPLLNYNPNDFLGNYEKLLNWRHNLVVNYNIKVLKKLIYLDWTQYPATIMTRPSYLVNAQYVPGENAMYIPLAYIQKPFLDLDERGFEYNLAYMGFTIGHELSHSLDDLGSQYDYKGDLHNWWSPEDKKKYKKIQNEIIKQYEVFASYDNFKFNATSSVGEDIADISGLTICEEYLSDFNIKNKNIPIMTAQSFKDFYIYFTYQMKQKIKSKSIKYELITNPHPLDKYRTNVPLSRSIIFRTMYNIKKGDDMYWDNDKNIW